MNVSIIAAVARHNAIGRNGDLLFHLSPDLRRFKQLTSGHTVIMGRKTFESLPKGALPNRRNIVVSRSADRTCEGAERAVSVADAIRMASEAGESEAFIIGGGQIYAQALPMADRLELTYVEAEAPDADTFFPEVDPSQWEETASDGPHLDPKSGLTYVFVCLSRK